MSEGCELETDVKIHWSRALDSQQEPLWDRVRDRSTKLAEQGRHDAKQLYQRLDRYIRCQPMQALIAAAVVGGVLGLLYKRH